MNQNFELLREALRLMTEEQKAKLLENFVQLSKQARVEEKLEEFSREQQMREFTTSKHF